MGIEINFEDTRFNELDFIILNDIFKLTKERIKNHQVNSCKIIYNYKYLLDNFTMEQISEVFNKVFNISYTVEHIKRKCWEHLTPTMEYEDDNSMMFEIFNLKNLKENFFIDSTIKKNLSDNKK